MKNIKILLFTLLVIFSVGFTYNAVYGSSGSGGITVTVVYTVSTSAGTGGSISPTSRTSVSSGSTTTFTISPNSGYSISSVSGCSGSLSGTTYTTGAITANCTVTASFVANSYPISYSITGSGTAGPSSCTYGSSVTPSCSPNTGWSTSSCPATFTCSTSNSKSVVFVQSPVNCVGSWSDTSICSVTCGGGVKQQVYTITTPASNGGTACPYSNGATRWGTTSCNTSACLVPSGGITATDCTISAGNSSCNTTLTWSTSNPIGTSQVTTPTNITVATANSSSGKSYSISYGSRSFYLYNDGDLLDSDTASAYCASGTEWDGSSCETIVVPSGGITATDCTISAGNSSCNTTLTWSTSNPIGTSQVTTPTNITVATANSSSGKSYSISYGNRSFYLYNDGDLLDSDTASAYCASGTEWDGSSCETIAPSSYYLSVSKAGNGSGTVSGAGSYDSGDVATATATPNSGSTFSGWSGDCDENGQVLMDDDKSCTATFTLSLITSGWITSTDCTITSGNGTCNTTLKWSTTNPVGTSAVTTGSYVTVATANSNSSGKSYAISYGDNYFFLYNNGDELDSDTAVATCASGTEWDYDSETCETVTVMSGSLSATSCTIDSGSGVCSTTLEWNTINPVGISAVTTNPNIIVATGNSSDSIIEGTDTFSISYGSREFYLYNNGEEPSLDVATATATCAPNTSWDSGSNVCTAVELVDGIDLIASDPTPTTVELGVPTIFTSTITNQGKLPAGQSFNNLFQKATGADYQGNPTDLENYLVSENISNLNSGNSREVDSTPITFNTAGTYYVRVCADKNSQGDVSGAIDESNENNNCSNWIPVSVGNQGGIDGYWSNETCGECNQSTCKQQCSRTCIPPTDGGVDCPGNDGTGVWNYEQSCYEAPACVDNGNGDDNVNDGGHGIFNIDFKATPARIFKGRFAILSWTSTATSCTSPDFNTENKANSSELALPITVSPQSSTTYTITCKEGSITSQTDTVTVKVDSINIIER